MNKLTRLTINKFRNVKPTTLEFRPGINVLLGKNAAGKTTLLRLISSLLENANELSQEELLDASFHVAGAPFELDQTTRRVHIDEPAFSRDLGRQSAGTFSRVQQTDSLLFSEGDKPVLKAELLPNEIVLEFEGSQSRVARHVQASPIPSLIESVWRGNPDKQLLDTVTNLLSVRAKTAGRMDESLERFNSLLRLTVQLDGSLWTWSFFRGVPESMFKALPISEGTTTTCQFAFLDRAAKVLGYESATARFDTERITPEPNRQIIRFTNLKFYFARAGEQVSHEWLSYGQKRLLAFFAHADASPDIVIADELVNGLHHEWISACIHELSGRQSFLTSQNPLLMDFLRFESIEEVRHTFIVCERTGGDSDAQLIWRNLTEDEAESFFLAYQTGIQRVSDILLTKGLW